MRVRSLRVKTEEPAAPAHRLVTSPAPAPWGSPEIGAKLTSKIASILHVPSTKCVWMASTNSAASVRSVREIHSSCVTKDLLV